MSEWVWQRWKGWQQDGSDRMMLSGDEENTQTEMMWQLLCTESRSLTAHNNSPSSSTGTLIIYPGFKKSSTHFHKNDLGKKTKNIWKEKKKKHTGGGGDFQILQSSRGAGLWRRRLIERNALATFCVSIYPPCLSQYAAVNVFVSFSTSFISFFLCFDHLEAGEEKEKNVQEVDRL